jgi:DNA repair exonuclease SbcCD ATPase subunit
LLVRRIRAELKRLERPRALDNVFTADRQKRRVRPVACLKAERRRLKEEGDAKDARSRAALRELTERKHAQAPQRPASEDCPVCCMEHLPPEGGARMVMPCGGHPLCATCRQLRKRTGGRQSCPLCQAVK